MDLFRKSDLLAQNLIEVIDHPLYDASPRILTSAAFCGLCLEHARAMRLLAEHGLYPSAMATLRVVFESLVRAIWLLYCASDTQIARLDAPLDLGTERLARSIPATSAMLDALRAVPAAAVPFQALAEFKDSSWAALNSFVHAGLHPLARMREGYPAPLVEQTVRLCNGLAMVAGMQLCILTGITGLQKRLQPLHARFADCLPLAENAEKPAGSV